jgi:hypothetical protein
VQASIEGFSAHREYGAAERLVTPYGTLTPQGFSKTAVAPRRGYDLAISNSHAFAKGVITKLATPNVTLLGYRPFEVLLSLLQKARAFMFVAEEDFGIAPVEAQACGPPVLAFGVGGGWKPLSLARPISAVSYGCAGSAHVASLREPVVFPAIFTRTQHQILRGKFGRV